MLGGKGDGEEEVARSAEGDVADEVRAVGLWDDVKGEAAPSPRTAAVENGDAEGRATCHALRVTSGIARGDREHGCLAKGRAGDAATRGVALGCVKRTGMHCDPLARCGAASTFTLSTVAASARATCATGLGITLAGVVRPEVEREQPLPAW